MSLPSGVVLVWIHPSGGLSHRDSTGVVSENSSNNTNQTSRESFLPNLCLGNPVLLNPGVQGHLDKTTSTRLPRRRGRLELVSQATGSSTGAVSSNGE